jgi:hypothetical protein
VRTNLKNDADFIKILATGAMLSKGISPGAQQYSDEEIRAAVVEARRWGKHRLRTTTKHATFARLATPASTVRLVCRSAFFHGLPRLFDCARRQDRQTERIRRGPWCPPFENHGWGSLSYYGADRN